MNDQLVTIAASATGVSIINLIAMIVQFCLSQKEKKSQKKLMSQEEQCKVVDSLRAGMMAMMLDRIQYLCKCYIEDKSVDFDDRRRLHIMHDIYHNDLKGNGDLDLLMKEVDSLPLSSK